MYDRHLETFIQVADCGSFLKASDQLYISANAITKQINLLEERLDVKLFHRSKQGLVLTEAGKLVYTEAKKMIRHSNTIVQKAKDLENRQESVIRIGVSLMNPANVLLEYWNKIVSLYPHLQLEIVPFEDTVPAFNDVLDHLGQKIDLLSCPYQTNIWGNRYQSFHLKDLPLCISCSKNHPLSVRKKLILTDLHGETLLIAKRGITPYLDPVRDELEHLHPEIHLKDVEYLDINVFNRIVSSRELVLSAQCWCDVHPLLVTIPVEWNYTLPYGLIYPNDPPQKILQFLAAIKTINF